MAIDGGCCSRCTGRLFQRGVREWLRRRCRDAFGTLPLRLRGSPRNQEPLASPDVATQHDARIES